MTIEEFENGTMVMTVKGFFKDMWEVFRDLFLTPS